MPWLINNNTSCKKWIPKNNHNLHMKAIKKIKNYIKNYTNQQIKLTKYKNCLYNVNKNFRINNTTDQEHENLKNSKNELLQKLKKHYGSNYKIQIIIRRGSVNLNKRSIDNGIYSDIMTKMKIDNCLPGELCPSDQNISLRIPIVQADGNVSYLNEPQ